MFSLLRLSSALCRASRGAAEHVDGTYDHRDVRNVSDEGEDDG